MAERIVTNPAPKVRYQGNAATVKAHRELVSTNEFQAAIDTALLQFQLELTQQNPDMGGAAANHFRMHGALQFVHLLKNLAEPMPVAPKLVDRDNLTH